jgi:malate/lactate dehydrogenase
MKVAVIGGAGGIGSSVAFSLLRTDHHYEIVVIDNRDNMIVSHVMDLQDALSLGGATSVVGGEMSDALDADIVVLSAAVPLTLNTSRDIYLHDNAVIVGGIVDQLAAGGFAGILLLMTNPVDPLLTWVARRTGWARERLLGYTLNDTQRFRTGLAQALDVAPQRVSCWVVGEHGAGAVQVFSTVTLDGKPVELTPDQRAHALDYAHNWYVRHVALDSGRTSTWSSGIGGALMVDAIARPTGEPFPASVILEGEYGVTGVSSSSPVVLGAHGLEKVVEIPLTSDESAQFIEAAAKIDELSRGLEGV